MSTSSTNFDVPQDEDAKVSQLRYGIYDALEAKFWGIPEKEPGSSRPGICWDIDLSSRSALMFKGSSQQPRKMSYLNACLLIEPDQENGLNVPTYFNILEPLGVRLRQVELMSHERLLGKLSAKDRIKIADELLLNARGNS